MKESLFTDQDYNLWWLMLLTRRTMYKARSRELYQYGITPEEAAVLFVTKAVGRKTTPAEISRWLLREPHSVSYLLRRMEKEGLIKMVKDLDRKNLIRVALTQKGHNAYRHSTSREVMHSILAPLSEEERQQLRSYLHKLLNEALKKIGIERKIPFPP